MKITSFNQNWKFYNDMRGTDEQMVNLPHDAMLTEERLANGKTGAAGGFFPGGRYVYRKNLFGAEEYRDKSIYLEFEGIYMKSTVYLNEEKVGGWIYGYTGFYVDLTDKLRIGEDNEIKVVADNSQTPNSRWYSGSGIYRNVNLLVGDKRHIKLDGVRVVTERIHPAVISVRTEVEDARVGGFHGDGSHDAGLNRETAFADLDMRVEVYEYHKGFDTTGKIKGLEDGDAPVATGSGTDCRIEMGDAALWDEESPNLYQVRVMLMEGETLVDEQSVVTGIRLLDWNAEKGMVVNGKSVKLRGGCIHHDNGILGACAPYAAEYRKAKILKNTGFNAIRSAHNPISKEMLAACDELGIYVMDEAFDQWQFPKLDYDYALYFDREWEKDCLAMILKDRNHPSVIMYSIGNEIGDTGKASGQEISHRLSRFFHKHDATRPTTNGINPTVSAMGGTPGAKNVTESDVVNPYEESAGSQATASLLANMIATVVPFISKMLGKPKKVEKLLKPCFDELDIVGYNYAEQCYEPHHEWVPKRIMVGSETYPQSVAERWPMIMRSPYVIGEFMWTAMDYLGEAGIGVPIYGKSRGGFNRPYPCVSGGCGAIDLIGHVDTEGYHAAIAWGWYKNPYIAVRPLNHAGEKYFFGMWRGTDAVASWSWTGMDGRMAEIEVYSEGKSVELFQDGVSLGKQTLEYCKAKYKTTYRAGELRAVSYDEKGTVLGEETLKSAGQGMRLSASAEATRLRADAEDMTFVSVKLTDENGIVKLLCDRKVDVCVSGAGVLAGIGSGNPVTEESFLGDSYTTWFGRMGFYVRSNGETGTARVKVSANGVETECIELTFC